MAVASTSLASQLSGPKSPATQLSDSNHLPGLRRSCFKLDNNPTHSLFHTVDSHIRLSSTRKGFLGVATMAGSGKGRSRWETLKLAYKTIGVFGGLVTSPLYVYPSMHLKSPTEDDYLGICSIIFWTLTLIGVVKYSGIALKVDDQGEGGTFALYSLLCRNLDIGILSAKRTSLNSSVPNGNLFKGSEKPSRLGKFFERDENSGIRVEIFD